MTIKNILHKCRKYIILYFIFVRNCIIAQMQYRTNFFISVLTECAFLMAKILYVVVVFTAGVSINGISPYGMLMFIGSYTFITGIMDMVFFPNVSKIPEYIRNGQLDIYVTKPVSLQFMTSFRYFDVGLAVPNVIASVIMVVISWTKLAIPVNFMNIAMYSFYTIVGIVLTYPVLFIPALLSFWTVKTQSLFDLIWSLWDFNNMPMTIYGRWIQRIGIFIIPIFVITNFAPMSVMGMLSPVYAIWSVAACFVFTFILRILWKAAVRNYTSASS